MFDVYGTELAAKKSPIFERAIVVYRERQMSFDSFWRYEMAPAERILFGNNVYFGRECWSAFVATAAN